MGEVYRGRDTRLNRAVAIKVLPADVARDETHRSRFAREARAISALAHPHICTLYDIGSENGTDFLVMELLDGETLTERLRKGPMPVETLLRHGIEIADALEKAHGSGVIHRDLKPGNMIVTRSGVKLLDFGLADLRQPRNIASEVATSVGAERLTKAGTIVGTLEFMAPEQLEGERADECTDIFALGNVLYRMAAGQPPFAGASEAAVVDAILHDDPPPIGERRPTVPPALERLILDCLRKDPAERIQSVHDVKLQLQAIADLSSRPVSPLSPRRQLMPWMMAALAVAATAGIMQLIHSTREVSPAPGIRRFTIELPDLPPSYSWGNREIVLSPDGKQVVLALNFGGWRLYVRAFDSAELTPLRGTENGFNPFFSPDGRWVGFTAAGKLKKVLLSGGAPVVIADAPRMRGASWAADGTIVFAPVSSGQGLSEVSADGGEVRSITRLGRGELSHRWPHILPGGRHVLYSVDDWGGSYDRKKIAVLDRRTGRTKILVEGGSDPRYFDGHLLFAKERALYAVRFDPETMSISGLPTPVVDDVVTHAGVGSVSADVARDGTLVYVPYEPAIEERTLMWVDRQGGAQPISPVLRPYWSPRLSPDQRQLIVGAGEARATDLWLLDLAGGSWSRVADKGKSLSPLWSRDGSRIFFSNNRDGVYNVFVIPNDGSGPAQRISNSEHWPFPRSVAPDGRLLLAEEQHPVTSYDVWQIDTAGGGAKPVLNSSADERDPDFSPDGKWIVYESDESGRSEVYVQRFPPGGRKWTVSTGGGVDPRWSPRGDELFYWNGNRFLSAKVSTQPTVSIGTPQMLFEADFAHDYDIAADAQRFVMLRGSPRAREGRLAVVLGWKP